MTVDIQSSPSKGRLYTGYTLTVLAILFMLMDAAMKFTHAAPVIEANRQLEIPLGLTPAIGVIALVCLALYAIPSTSVLGAILFTGYLGGAIAVHARVGNPIFTHTLFPIYVAFFIWGGLWFRDRTLRELFPLVHDTSTSASSKWALYTGYTITVIAALLVLLSAVMKFVYTPPAGAPPPAFPMEHIHTLAYIEFVLVALYLIPRTAFFGAVFLGGYLGGATMISLRSGESVGGSIVPAIIAVTLWVGYWLRNARVRSLIPLRNK
jgi:hypothetical protein